MKRAAQEDHGVNLAKKPSSTGRSRPTSHHPSAICNEEDQQGIAQRKREWAEKTEINTHVAQIKGGLPYYQADGQQDWLDSNEGLREELYAQFFDGPGCIVIKGVYSDDVMERYNEWCEDYFSKPQTQKNTTHPKQTDKLVINDILESMSENDPELLLLLSNNQIVNGVLDTLLGFSTFGALTTHWIKPGGAGQTSHVDYPCHVGSGKFWNDDAGAASPNKLERMTTKHQLNHMLPYYSVQTLIASDAMNEFNGSTQCVPFSQRVDSLDLKIHDRDFYDAMEPKFVSTDMGKGDVFFFNRRLCHRGGHNRSENRRNSLIMQSVWLFGIGQHQIPHEAVTHNLGKCQVWTDMSAQEKESYQLRLKKPYPMDTTQHN